MCSFYSELLESNENNESVKKLTHFYFNCEDKHEYFVHKCRGHTFMYPRLHDMTYKCDCKDIEPFDTCDFRCYKFCVEKFRMHLQIFWFLSIIIWNMKLQNANRFLFQIQQSCGSLDNPLLDDMNEVKNPGN